MGTALDHKACNITADIISQHDLKSIVLSEHAVFAVVDPNIFTAIRDILKIHYVEFISLYPGMPSSEAIAHLPVVFKLEYFLLELMEEQAGVRFGVYFIANNNTRLVDLAGHLVGMCTAKNAAGDYVWLRFFEPYVMALLMNTCTYKQIEFVFGGRISCIMCEDFRTGNYYAWQYNIFSRKKKLINKGYLCLTSEQEQYLDDEHYEYFLYCVAAACFPYKIGDVSVASAISSVRAAALAAEHHGFYSMNHIYRFVSMACLYGWKFYDLPQFSIILCGRYNSKDAQLRALELAAENIRTSSV